LKCGGGETLTKHTTDDAFKFQLTVEEPKKLVEENTHTICKVPVSPKLESGLEVPQINAEPNPHINKLGKMMPELYNLEECAESEKAVKINLDLDLYQMEKV
jgi:hypothetical protein